MQYSLYLFYIVQQVSVLNHLSYCINLNDAHTSHVNPLVAKTLYSNLYESFNTLIYSQSKDAVAYCCLRDTHRHTFATSVFLIFLILLRLTQSAHKAVHEV